MMNSKSFQLKVSVKKGKKIKGINKIVFNTNNNYKMVHFQIGKTEPLPIKLNFLLLSQRIGTIKLLRTISLIN